MVLAALGLDRTCESVYRALLARPQLGLAELREDLGLSDADLRTALDKLSELALIRTSFDAPHSFRAVDPEIGVQALIARQQERLASEQQRIEQLRLAAAHLTAEFSLARPRHITEAVEHLEGIEEIRDRISILVKDVASDVMTLAPDGAQTAENMDAAHPQDLELLERGVRMRTVYLDSVRNSPATTTYAKWLTGLGGEVRTAPSLPIRLMILDHRTAIVPTDEADSGAGALVVTASGTLTALNALFETIWENAVPLGTATRDRNERGLTPQEAETLRLLSRGLTDEVVAKRLGVSPRTARRIAADLMELLGARSRFQAGCRAVARGWLTGDE
ncbi:LuxR C-terminal-related transcriptional regulator [Streptomyces cinnabarinus]|uniref:LuxR C-terminal-related transcriptional regulator n=1 Tax=Streptomyces cinnabarinus TaxID=67287 RepID=A0ABY7KAM6_9ACTN|nr:LuxR family transcriptional regulator [Streptomyces cinnabarinus]WAZ19971.1 LuxR C-terminal-related transcriptional regulator [Streptomyces cinnabarinus]